MGQVELPSQRRARERREREEEVLQHLSPRPPKYVPPPGHVIGRLVWVLIGLSLLPLILAGYSATYGDSGVFTFFLALAGELAIGVSTFIIIPVIFGLSRLYDRAFNAEKVRMDAASDTWEREYREALNAALKSSYQAEESRSRYIPSSVKQAVWQRDGGRCVDCSSQSDLEYDHDIPFSLGGSNGVENIRLLCRSCNQRKSNRIM